MPGAAFLEGDRLTLSTVEEDDLPFLVDLTNDPDVRRSTSGHAPRNLRDRREWFESLGEGDDVALLARAEGERVGLVSLDGVHETWGRAEVGYTVAPAHWGNGYATEAVELLVAYAFDERRLHKVAARTYATNAASERVLEKAGFEREATLACEAFVDGEYVDLHCWRRFAEEG